MFGLFTLLFTLFVFTLNPSVNYQNARDSERQAEIAQIHSAIGRWVADGKGSTSELKHSASVALPVCAGIAPNFTNGVPFPSLQIATELVEGGYILQHPQDPETGITPYYNVCYSSKNGPLTIYAPNVDGARITLTR